MLINYGFSLKVSEKKPVKYYQTLDSFKLTMWYGILKYNYCSKALMLKVLKNKGENNGSV